MAANANQAHRATELASAKKDSLFGDYQTLPGVFDEYHTASNVVRPSLRRLVSQFEAVGRKAFRARQRIADNAFRKGGVTFSVYSDRRGTEKIFPFDLIPRVVPGNEWEHVERGLLQRVQALNAFISDVYGDQRIVEAGVVPRELLESCDGYLQRIRGVRPNGGVYIHIAGIDLIRDANGDFLVLEDNVRTPSGVSYVLENRSVMKRVFPLLFAASPVRPVSDYPSRLGAALRELAPAGRDNPVTVILTPGHYNSAYFEHGFLARTMGVELVQGSDLYVRNKHVYMKTTHGDARVDVIYRRVDDEFLDPKVFREDSVLGVPGLFDVYAEGNVTLANAIGNGVADDKAIYPYVPDMIRYYLDQEPILGQIDTFLCSKEEDLRRVLDELNLLVVKRVDASGGYGMLFGPSASARELREFSTRIKREPRKYIAQRRVELSTCPTWGEKKMVPCRVDLRPYVVTGKTGSVLPGGLTRVALTKGSYVVNSSQGGGSKDTWVLDQPDS